MCRLYKSWIFQRIYKRYWIIIVNANEKIECHFSLTLQLKKPDSMFLFLDAFIAGSISLLGFIILTNPREINVLGNRLLAIFLFLVAIIIFDKGLIDGNFYQNQLEFSGMSDVLLLFVPPTLYLSVGYFVSLDKAFDRKDLKHYLAPVLLSPIALYVIFNAIEYKLNTSQSATCAEFGIDLCFLFSIAFYLFLSYAKLQKHQKNIELFTAETDTIDLNWLKYSLLGIAGMGIVFFAEFYFNSPTVFKYASIGYLIATYILSYFALRQSEIFPFDAQERVEIKDIIAEQNPTEQDPIQKQERLSENVLLPLKIRLLELMQNEKIHLEDDLNLPKLAQKMSISTHDLSYLLNEGFGKSFFQFINDYRIEDAKKLLASEKHDHLNMVGIAYAAGFSSKTTFYTAFKKATNQSPSEFQNTVRKQS